MLSTLRQDLFSEAVGKALCDSGDEVRACLSRGGGTSLSEKLSVDIWTIFSSIRRQSSIPQYLTISRSTVFNRIHENTAASQSTQPLETSNSVEIEAGHDLFNSTPVSTTSTSYLRVVTWKCKGFHHGKVYMCDMLKNLDTLILNEHWLWPYGLYQLGEIQSEFDYIAVSDHRLNPVEVLPFYGGNNFTLHQWKAS